MQPCIKTMVWFVLVYHDLFFANYSIYFSATSEIVTKKSPLRGLFLSSFRIRAWASQWARR